MTLQQVFLIDIKSLLNHFIYGNTGLPRPVLKPSRGNKPFVQKKRSGFLFGISVSNHYLN